MRPPKERVEDATPTLGNTKELYRNSIFADSLKQVKKKLALPILPDIARALLKGAIMSMLNAGLITGASAEQLISLLQLRDA